MPAEYSKIYNKHSSHFLVAMRAHSVCCCQTSQSLLVRFGPMELETHTSYKICKLVTAYTNVGLSLQEFDISKL